MEKLDKKFKNEKLGLELDIYEDNGKEWFKAQDISEFLEYIDTRHMTRNLDSMEKHSCLHSMETVQGNKYEAVFLDEYALYEAVLKIRKVDMVRYQKAQAFQDWVFGEVLPEIRKHGAYILADDEKQAYERAIAGYQSTLKRVVQEQAVARDFAEARTRTIDKLNNRVEDAEYNRDELILCCNDLRFIIGKMFAKRNNLNIDVETIPVTRQEEIFNQIALEYPELKDTWYKVISIMRGEEV